MNGGILLRYLNRTTNKIWVTKLCYPVPVLNYILGIGSRDTQLGLAGNCKCIEARSV